MRPQRVEADAASQRLVRPAVGVALYRQTADQLSPRPLEAIEAFFDGLDVLPPGLVPCAAWGADASVGELRATRGFLGGVAVKR